MEGTIADRINQILKERKVKKTEMARRLGISDSSVSTMCSGKTKPSGQTITMICKEFGVNEEWLRTGQGKPWAPVSSSDLERLARDRGLTTQEYILIQKFIELPPEIRRGIVDYVAGAAGALAGISSSTDPDPGLGPNPDPAPREPSGEELHAALEREIEKEKTAAEESGVS